LKAENEFLGEGSGINAAKQQHRNGFVLMAAEGELFGDHDGTCAGSV
jgi:hypothetical protein